MSELLRYLLLPFRAPMLLILLLVSAYVGLDWSVSRAALPGHEAMDGLAWTMECLQAVVVVVLCTLPDLLLRQLSSLMATSRVVSLVATLLLVTLVGIYMLHLEMLANVLVLGCSVLLAHPGRYRLSFQRLIPAAAALGFDGAEAYYDYAMQPRWQPTPVVCEAIARLLEDHALLRSCGTDTHGLELCGR